MKLYLFDRALYLLAGVLILVVSFIFFPPILAVIVGVLVFAFWGIICYRLVLLPVDLAFGRNTAVLFFSTQLCLEELEFFKKKYIRANFVNSYAFGEVQCLYQYIICVCNDEF